MLKIKELHLSSLSELSRELQNLIEQRLWLQVILGLLAGIAVGILIGPDVGWVEADLAGLLAAWMALPGYLFLALIQMIVVPLVLASVIRGLTAASSIQQLKKLGIYGGLFFMVMTIFSSTVGIVVSQSIDPAQFVDKQLVQSTIPAADMVASEGKRQMPSLQELPQKVVALLPSNPLHSFSSGDMLRIVIFSIVFGIALMTIPVAKSAPLYDLLGSIQEVCMAIVGWAMRIAPFAVFGLIVKLTAMVGAEVLLGMLVYVLTVVAGLFIVAIAYLLIIVLYARLSVGKFLQGTREALLLAFSTSSSAAVMPLTIKSLEENLKVQSATVRFLVPLGATVNMSGTALYQTVATLFLASLFGIDLDTTALMLIVTMTVFASMGSPATPGASIVILAMMLENIGIPQAGLALLLGVDRILDMCRTLVNVLGDMAASIVVDKMVAS